MFLWELDFLKGLCKEGGLIRLSIKFDIVLISLLLLLDLIEALLNNY